MHATVACAYAVAFSVLVSPFLVGVWDSVV